MPELISVSLLFQPIWHHEVLTGMMRRSSLIFGDGAACAIVERGDGRSGILASLVEMYPTGSELCEIRAGAHDATLAQVWITTISYFICRARGCSDKPLVSLKIISSVYWKKWADISGYCHGNSASGEPFIAGAYAQTLTCANRCAGGYLSRSW